LNLGHTIGHALEGALAFSGVRHGEAVALGMLASAKLSVQYKNLDPDFPCRLQKLLQHLGLPTRLPEIDIDSVISTMAHDKKKAKKLRFVYLTALGHGRLDDAPSPDVIAETLNEMKLDMPC
ncbi:MAG: 3-dehydroquinate synthase, partial [Candidatus Eremiobacteraeota bacterium]|nr:3-dehydroquinate synthase [Candidatus Eremiobacteraeota bacterium]